MRKLTRKHWKPALSGLELDRTHATAQPMTEWAYRAAALTAALLLLATAGAL